jgi:type IV secretory pathway VirB2 component (pilin)
MWYFLFFILLPEIETNKIWLYLILYFTGVFALIGVVIFGINELYNDHLSFSFAACVIGGIAGIIAGAVPVVAKYKS